MLCCTSMMFTCIKVFSCLVLREGWRCEIWKLGQTTSCWVGQGKQIGHKISESNRRAQSNPRTRPGWTCSWGAAKNSRIAAQVCINVYKRSWCLWFIIKEIPKIQYVVAWLICLFFRRLKINHVSHEFILEFGTVTNTNVLYVKMNQRLNKWEIFQICPL